MQTTPAISRLPFYRWLPRPHMCRIPQKKGSGQRIPIISTTHDLPRLKFCAIAALAHLVVQCHSCPTSRDYRRACQRFLSIARQFACDKTHNRARHTFPSGVDKTRHRARRGNGNYPKVSGSPSRLREWFRPEMRAERRVYISFSPREKSATHVGLRFQRKLVTSQG
jgi:hypothetical protein